MATTPVMRNRVERRLDLLLAEVEELPATAADWDQLEEWEQASISLEWSHLMADYLTQLDSRYRAGEMAPDQQARYQDLLCKLREQFPIVERLNLYRPPVSLAT